MTRTAVASGDYDGVLTYEEARAILVDLGVIDDE